MWLGVINEEVRETFTTCQVYTANSNQILQASDYLTEMARFFVVTGDITFYDRY